MTQPPTTDQSATITIEGMHCGNCVNKVTAALQSLPGVSQATVDLANKRATIRYNPSQATMPKLMSAITAAGFKPTAFTRS
jgi:copper chaperone CopZ